MWELYAERDQTRREHLQELIERVCNLNFADMIDDAPLLEAVALLQDGKSLRQAKPADFPTSIIAKGVQRTPLLRQRIEKESPPLPRSPDLHDTVDQDVQAATLEKAAQNGTPFCAVCEHKKAG